MKRLLWILPLLPGVVQALHIREYSATTHDRFVNFPAAPAFNGNAWFNSAQFTGVGWAQGDLANQRQMVLVSPRHVLLPTHWKPAQGSVISFLNANGQVITRTLESMSTVLDNGNSTDLTLGRLNAPLLPADLVDALPYYNSGSEPQGASLKVFGFTTRVGTGTIGSFSFHTETNTGSTRMFQWAYNDTSLPFPTDDNDCYLEIGDSGSPSFTSVGNGQSAKPALVGIHSLSGTSPGYHVGLDSYVPYYAASMNTILAADGYQMRPATISTSTLSITSTVQTSPSPAARKVAQSATVQINNTSGIEANNPTLSLTFPAGQGPTSINGAGWVVDQSGPTTWLLHRASLAAGANATVTLNWNALPDAASIPIDASAVAYNAVTATAALQINAIQPFASWSSSLPAGQQTLSADPDGDGRINLLEYALGSTATQGSNSLSNGQPATPTAQSATGFTEISVPVRTDSSARGLWYRPEYSTDLTSPSWTTTAPPGTTVDFVNYAPAVPGFARMRIRLTQPSYFVRINVALDENQPGMDVPVSP